MPFMKCHIVYTSAACCFIYFGKWHVYDEKIVIAENRFNVGLKFLEIIKSMC